MQITIAGLQIQADVSDIERSEDGAEEYGVVEIAAGVFVQVAHPFEDFDDQAWTAVGVERRDTP